MSNIISTKGKSRNSNIELLRILAMFLIVFSHYFVHGATDFSNLPLCFNKVLSQLFYTGNLGVVIFVMISGYFLSTSKFKLNRIIQLELQVIFYSISIFAIFCIIDRNNFSIKSAVNSFLPFSRGAYWFFSAYLMLCFLYPYINKVLDLLSRKQFLVAIALLVLFISVMPTFLHLDSFKYSGYIFQFVMYYCIGAYIRKYPENLLLKYRYILAVLCVAGLIVLVVGMDYLGHQNMINYFYSRYSTVFVLLAAVLLVIFSELPEKSSKIVNHIGGATFGVYLIHENDFMRSFLWSELFNNSKYATGNYLIVHFILSVLIVYSICTLIEIIRKNIIEKPIMKSVNKLISKFYEKHNDITDLI